MARHMAKECEKHMGIRGKGHTWMKGHTWDEGAHMG